MSSGPKSDSAQRRASGAARPISDEELQLRKRARRRLVGAVVLVSAVAVILPMVLDSEPRAVTQNVDIQIPSPDIAESKPKNAKDATQGKPAVAPPPVIATAPMRGMPGAGKDPAPAAEPKPDAAPAADSGSRESDKEQPKSAAKEPPKAAVKEAPKASADGAYVVQVAALADGARVKQLQKQMSAAGIKAYTEAISTKTGEMTRVRAGPYATREAAESARTALKKAGLDGKVVPK